MAIATLTSEPTGPLSQTQQHQVAAAHERAKKIRKAASVASFNGWVTGIFAVCSAPFAVFSLSGFVMTVGLSIVAYNEFRGRKRLLQFDQRAPAFLGWNQVAFLALIVCYCIWMLIAGLTSDGPLAAELKAKPELGAVFDSTGEFDELYRMLVVAVYGSIIVLTGVFQGLNALYYFSRRKYVNAYVEETPDWVLDLQRLTPPS